MRPPSACVHGLLRAPAPDVLLRLRAPALPCLRLIARDREGRRGKRLQLEERGLSSDAGPEGEEDE